MEGASKLERDQHKEKDAFNMRTKRFIHEVVGTQIKNEEQITKAESMMVFFFFFFFSVARYSRTRSLQHKGAIWFCFFFSPRLICILCLLRFRFSFFLACFFFLSFKHVSADKRLKAMCFDVVCIVRLCHQRRSIHFENRIRSHGFQGI